MKLELLTCETVKVATSDATISTSTSFDGTGGETGVGGLVGTAGRGGVRGAKILIGCRIGID